MPWLRDIDDRPRDEEPEDGEEQDQEPEDEDEDEEPSDDGNDTSLSREEREARGRLYELIESANSLEQLRACVTEIELQLLKGYLPESLGKVLLACEGRRRQTLEKQIKYESHEKAAKKAELVTGDEWDLIVNARTEAAKTSSSAPPAPILVDESEEGDVGRAD